MRSRWSTAPPAEPDAGRDDERGERPFDLLRHLAIQDVEVAPALRHVEIYTRGGLLTLLWHGETTADRVAIMCGGAMGGLLGPANGLWHDLGVTLAAQGIGSIRVGYRQPNALSECVLDVAAAADLAARAGGKRFVALGHSFGGAVAIGAAVALPEAIVGVATLATQSSGCEHADRLAGRPLLLLHGDRDELLPVECSLTVQMIAGAGEVVVLEGAGHLLSQAGDELRERLGAWIPRTLSPS